jgi:hypothetical protein
MALKSLTQASAFFTPIADGVIEDAARGEGSKMLSEAFQAACGDW